MASGLTSSSEPIEPTRVWTREEWERDYSHETFKGRWAKYRQSIDDLYPRWGPDEYLR